MRKFLTALLNTKRVHSWDKVGKKQFAKEVILSLIFGLLLGWFARPIIDLVSDWLRMIH